MAVVQHIYTKNNTWNNTNNHRTTQVTTNLEECGPCPVFASFTLAFALQLRKKHGKTSVRVRRNLSYYFGKSSNRLSHYVSTLCTHLFLIIFWNITLYLTLKDLVVIILTTRFIALTSVYYIHSVYCVYLSQYTLLNPSTSRGHYTYHQHLYIISSQCIGVCCVCFSRYTLFNP